MTTTEPTNQIPPWLDLDAVRVELQQFEQPATVQVGQVDDRITGQMDHVERHECEHGLPVAGHHLRCQSVEVAGPALTGDQFTVEHGAVRHRVDELGQFGGGDVSSAAGPDPDAAVDVDHRPPAIKLRFDRPPPRPDRHRWWPASARGLVPPSLQDMEVHGSPLAAAAEMALAVVINVGLVRMVTKTRQRRERRRWVTDCRLSISGVLPRVVAGGTDEDVDTYWLAIDYVDITLEFE